MMLHSRHVDRREAQALVAGRWTGKLLPPICRYSLALYAGPRTTRAHCGCLMWLTQRAAGVIRTADEKAFRDSCWCLCSRQEQRYPWLPC
jgi:hypothetical protein